MLVCMVLPKAKEKNRTKTKENDKEKKTKIIVSYNGNCSSGARILTNSQDYIIECKYDMRGRTSYHTASLQQLVL